MVFQPAGMSLRKMTVIVEHDLRRDSSPTGKLFAAIALPRAYYDQTLFMRSLNRPEHLNVTTWDTASMMLALVRIMVGSPSNDSV